MKRAKHDGSKQPVNCPACITSAEQARMPWQASYVDVFTTRVGDELERKHRAAVQRAERNQAMRDLGLVRTPYGWE